jgi:pimeloyl-ACP methyl ester carboxylesterase
MGLVSDRFKSMPARRRYDAPMDGSTVYVEVHGPPTNPPLVLVHGAPDRSTSFRGVLPYFSDRRVVLYDRRGYGRSIHAQPARTMIDHANDLLAILDECTGPPIVVAHSFGSNLTMLAATIHPNAFSAVGLWEPPLTWVEWWPRSTKRYNAKVAASDDPADDIEDMYRMLLGDQGWEHLRPDVQTELRSEGPAFQGDMAAELDSPLDFQDMVVPTLVGYGTATVKEHSEGARWLVDCLPNARLYAVPGAGHFAPRTHPKEFAAFMGAVVAMAEPGGAARR